MSEGKEDLQVAQDVCVVWQSRARDAESRLRRAQSLASLVRIALSEGRIDDVYNMLIEIGEDKK